MTCSKQSAQLGVLREAHQKDVYNKCNQQQNHRIAERLSEHFLHTGCNCVLTEVRVNYHSTNIKSFFQTYQHRTEIADQTTGTNR